MTSFLRTRLRRAADNMERGWPGYLFGGRMRTSTAVLVIAFLAFWWVYDDHQQASKSTNKTTQVPATQVVPPGYVPDPNYTWVPRTQVQQPTPTVTVTETPPPTTTTPPPPTTTSPTPPPLIPPIVLPPPFGPPPSTTSSAPAQEPPPPPPLLPGLPFPAPAH